MTEGLLEFLGHDDMLQATEEEGIRYLNDKYELNIDKELFNLDYS